MPKRDFNLFEYNVFLDFLKSFAFIDNIAV